MMSGIAVAESFVPREVRGMQKHLGNIVAVRDVRRSGQTVVGRVVNRSDAPIGDVRLEFEHVFLWDDDDRHPGFDDPSRRESLVVNQTIAPGESVAFQHRLEAPLPQRGDGTFMTKVAPVGVTQIPRGAASAY